MCSSCLSLLIPSVCGKRANERLTTLQTRYMVIRICVSKVITPAGQIMKSRVLFICTGNSARSQMAEGLLRSMAGDVFDVYSAGTQPRGLNPLAVEVMASQGMDISQQQSTPLQTYQNDTFDYVITLCDRAHETCPSVKGQFDTIHWAVNDPAANNRLKDFQLVLKDLKTRLAYLVIIEEKRRKAEQGTAS